MNDAFVALRRHRPYLIIIIIVVVVVVVVLVVAVAAAAAAKAIQKFITHIVEH